MLKAWVDKSSSRIILQTDDPSVRYLLEAVKKETKYIPWTKQWGQVTTTFKVYDKKTICSGIYTFVIGLGWAGYIINVFKNFMSPEDYNGILKDAVYSESSRDIPFPELRPEQNDDVLHMLKYKRGLFGCYTGYGKTQIIATLANYFHSLGKKVMIVAPGKKPKDELVKRLDRNYGIKIPTPDLSLNCMITSGLLNRKDVKDPGELAKLETLWATYDTLLVDEVEYTINESGEFIYDRLTGLERAYAFSGTADKKAGEAISFINGLDDVVTRNMGLVKYFGPSLVYRMPLKMKIDNIRIKTSALGHVKFEAEDFDEDSNVYMNVLNRIWTTPEVCNLVVKLAKRYPKLFIPINNLTSILSEWIDNYFKGELRVLLVCHEGYIYYDLGGNKTKLTLSEACDYIRNGLVDVIPSTSSGYRALDFPELENILLIASNIAGVVLQCIGRVARGTHMNIISLDTINGKKIPVYSKGAEEREELFKSYYKYCEMVDSVIYENNI